MILYDEGWSSLNDYYNNETEDFFVYLDGCPHSMMPTVVEAIASALRLHAERGWPIRTDVFASHVNDVLAEDRVSYELIEGQMIERGVQELHVALVVPTLRLLAGRTGWEGVETAYQNAIKEIGVDPADAITDAGTALEEALVLLGCEGNALGSLLVSARKKGLLAAHDAKIIDWVSADRSSKGDADNATPATRDDVWLTVHVVGALLVRLAGGAR